MSKIENIDEIAAKLTAIVIQKTEFPEFDGKPLHTQSLIEGTVNTFLEIKRQLNNKNQ